MTSVDWSAGRYERTAEMLAPAAAAVVTAAAPRRGERVLDVGCGTGNATLLAAAEGVRSTGVDPTPRLLKVARERAAAEGLRADFVDGDAADLPFVRGAADVVLSVFGVIFAPDPARAAEEIGRVNAPRGRFVLSAWLPVGPIVDAMKAVAAAIDPEPEPESPPFAWHELGALQGLLGPHGYEVAAEQRRIAFTGSSPAAFLEQEIACQPMWIALEARGDSEDLRARCLEALEAGNEDADAFRATSDYVVAVARRG